MTPNYDIRQSDSWAKFLYSFGWKSHRIKSGANILYKKYKFGSFVKIQRPPILFENDIKEIEDFCKSQKAMFIKLEPFIGQDGKLLDKNGFRPSQVPQVPSKTMFIDLTESEEELWNKLSRSAKYSVRRAQRKGAQVKFFNDPNAEITNIYYEMCRETGKRKSFYVPPIKDLQSRIKAFGKNSNLAMVYNEKGELCGGKLFLADRDIVVYSTGGSTIAGTKSKAGYELLWKSFLYLKGLGYKVLDLEGLDDIRFPFATNNWGGFSHFKERFGGYIVEFPRPRIKYFSPILKIMSKFTELPL